MVEPKLQLSGDVQHSWVIVVTTFETGEETEVWHGQATEEHARELVQRHTALLHRYGASGFAIDLRRV